tara:strand:+ start:1582 stop:3291 length:1710 start_codon:yes stop_codon:yes gene_type:complete
MAKKEVLELEVKSNIKGIAKDTKDWNKELKTTKETIEDVNEEGKEVVGEMQLLGVSINGLKSAWKGAAKGAKFLFSSIKVGIASTGIGFLLLAFGALSAWFTKTKKGAEALEIVFSGIGAAVKVIVDRVAKFGGGIAKLLTGDVKGGLKDMKNSFIGIGKEIKADTLLTLGLVRAQQLLADSQRELNVETEKQRAEIERLKLIAEDVTKSQKERLMAAEDAFAIENKLVNQRVANAEKELHFQQQSMELTAINGENTAEELDREAELKMNVFRITQESTTKQIELNNKINAIKAEGAAKEAAAAEKIKVANQERLDGLQAIMDLETERLNQQIITAAGLLDAHYQSQLDAIDQEKNAVTDKWFAIIEAEEEGSAMRLELEKAYQEQLAAIDEKYKSKDKDVVKDAARTFKQLSDQEVKWAEMTANEKMNIASSTAGSLSKILGEETEAGKAMAIVQATIDTYKGAQSAYASMAGIPVVGPVLGGIAAAAAVASGIKNVQAISSAGGGGGGGMSTPSVGTSPQVPAPQMMSGAFDLTGGVAPEPIKTFVVTDEMTSSQNQLANIRRRATI